MKVNRIYYLFIGLFLFVTFGCKNSEPDPSIQLDVLSITMNGSNLVNGADQIPVMSTLTIVFSSAVTPSKFESAISITSASGSASYAVSYANANSKVNIELSLDYGIMYNLLVSTAAFGVNGEQLSEGIDLLFTTQEDDVIRSMAPCVSVEECKRSVLLTGSNGAGEFEFYSNYPIYLENAEWENLTQAVIVVHGASHNPNDYYSYLTNTLNSESLSESTVLIAPFFKPSAPGSVNDFYWSGTGWRDGKESSNSNKISSFQVLDEIINQLSDKQHFPVLDQIIVTGQSSGGRFTHVFAPANTSESLHPEIRFDYIVSESQYFYYPDGRRMNESNNQLYTPSGCAGYEVWPFGFNAVPPYLASQNINTFNQQFIERSIHYLLGNGNGSDGSLNTSDCSATVLGSTRYHRGENMFQYMQLVYPEIHRHTKTIANGISHDGSAMYQSPEFKALLNELLNR
jgi:hypothetical protein